MGIVLQTLVLSVTGAVDFLLARFVEFQFAFAGGVAGWTLGGCVAGVFPMMVVWGSGILLGSNGVLLRVSGVFLMGRSG